MFKSQSIALFNLTPAQSTPSRCPMFGYLTNPLYSRLFRLNIGIETFGDTLVDQWGSFFFEEFDFLLDLLDQWVDLFSFLIEVLGDFCLFNHGRNRKVNIRKIIPTTINPTTKAKVSNITIASAEGLAAKASVINIILNSGDKIERNKGIPWIKISAAQIKKIFLIFMFYEINSNQN